MSSNEYISEKELLTSTTIISTEKINNDDDIYACTDCPYEIEILKID